MSILQSTLCHVPKLYIASFFAQSCHTPCPQYPSCSIVFCRILNLILPYTMSTTFHSTSLYPTTYNAQTLLDYQTILDIIQSQLNGYSADPSSTSPSTPFHIINPDCAHHATSIALILSYFHPTTSIILSPYSIIFSVRTLQNL